MEVTLSSLQVKLKTQFNIYEILIFNKSKFSYGTHQNDIKKSTPLVANCANTINIPTHTIFHLLSTDERYFL